VNTPLRAANPCPYWYLASRNAPQILNPRGARRQEIMYTVLFCSTQRPDLSAGRALKGPKPHRCALGSPLTRRGFYIVSLL
jgi:hypothetical protein